MDINQPLDSGINALEITPESREYLLETAKWSRFLSIVGFVFIGFLVLIAIFGGTFLGSYSSELNDLERTGMPAMLGGGILFALYFLMALFYFFPTYYLFKFSTNTITAIKSSSTEGLTDGLKNLKSTFKFWGIFTAIILGIYALIFVFGFLGILIG